MRVLESGATQSYNMGKNKKHKLRKTKEASESSDDGSGKLMEWWVIWNILIFSGHAVKVGSVTNFHFIQCLQNFLSFLQIAHDAL